MNNYSKIYWLTRLDNIQVFLSVSLAIYVFIFIIYFTIKLVAIDDDDLKDYEEQYSKYKIWSFVAMLITGLLLVFLPSKNEMILIYAGGKTMDYVQGDTSLSKIPYQTTAIISEYLDKSIKELKESK